MYDANEFLECMIFFFLIFALLYIYFTVECNDRTVTEFYSSKLEQCRH